MRTRTTSTLLWCIICVLALVIGPILWGQELAAESADNVPSSSFKADFPLKQVREKTFKNETVQLDGNEFIECRFDNVVLEFEGQAPFRFTNVHFENQSRIEIRSKNPVVRATLELVNLLMKLENAGRPIEKK